MSQKTPGQCAYEAHCATQSGPVSGWEGARKEAWEAAANAVIEMCAERIRKRRLEEDDAVDDFDEGWMSGTIDAEDALRNLKVTSHG